MSEMDSTRRLEDVARKLGIIVEPDGKEFHAYCSALPGLHASGQTEQEAVENALELAAVYLLSLLKHGDPLPPPREVSDG